MAITTRMMYTLLPNGGPSAGYKLSIFLSPRLEGGPAGSHLSDYALGNWCQTLKNRLTIDNTLVLELDAAGGQQVITRVSSAYVSNLTPTLWDALFPPATTPVTARVFQDMSKRWIRSYSVGPIETYIQALYNLIGSTSPSSFPDLKGSSPVTDLLDAMGRAKPIMDEVLPKPRQRGQAPSYNALPANGGPAINPDKSVVDSLNSIALSLHKPGQPDLPLGEMFRAQRFFKRGNQGQYRSVDEGWDETLIPDRPTAPQFDFNQVITALADHPFLLRKLGLVIDCVLDPTPSLPNHFQMQLLSNPAPAIGSLTPWTRYQINATSGFRATPFAATSDVMHGLLRLDTSDFAVLQTEPDGNALKVFDYAVNLHYRRDTLLAERSANPSAKTSQAPEETSLPALRSGGLMVLRGTRDAKLWNTAARQAAYESNPDAAVLYADDLVRGYRYDVNYRGTWESLCRRTGSYAVAGFNYTQPGPDEGYLKAESASSDPVQIPANQQQPDLYVHETMAAWRNWSLVTSMPGKTIEPVPQAMKKQTEEVRVPNKTPGGGFNIVTNFIAERKSLPPLRYGETYRFRARTVDLAGNGWAPPPSNLFPTADSDPVPTGVGESPSIVYRRHDPVPAPMLIVPAAFRPGESMETIAIRSRGDAMPEALPMGFTEAAIFNPTCQRWVAAPKTSVGDAETHGVFDTKFKLAPDVSRTLLSKESGSFDDLPTATIMDRSGNVVAPATLPPGWKKGDPLPNGDYFIHQEDPVLLPYLPDPLAHGVAFMPKDGSGVVYHRPFVSSGWPAADPFKLLLKAAAGASPVLQMGGSEVDMLLPKGTMLTVNYASAVVPPTGAPSGLAEGELDLMERWHGLTPGATGGQQLTRNHGYQHWMLTPFRTMLLVHAVEKPISAPQLTALSVGRSYGDTFVLLRNGSVTLHAPSTGEIELRGRWRDYYDDPASDKDPYTVDRDGHVLDRKVDYSENPVLIPPAVPPNTPPERIKHEFGDTKHRWLYYHAVGTTRYREYFGQDLTSYQQLVPDATYPDIIRKKTLITVDGPEFLELVAGNPTPLDVKSTVRPEPPQPLYVIPTFKWADTAQGHQRSGRGLRIYLARGWYSSGQDEQLGIVLTPSAVPGDVEPYRGYITQWGSDPMFDRLGPSSFVQASNFTSDPAFPATTPKPVTADLLLAETSLSVRVVPFDPIWDPARKLWFVDVVMQPTNLFNTFVRFALCRYQAHSLTNVEISRVVRTEFAQLVADRNASISFSASSITVALFGPASRSKLGQQAFDPNAVGGGPPPSGIQGLPAIAANPNAGKGRRVVAQLEWRPLPSSGDLGWEVAPGGANVLPSYTEVTGADPFDIFWIGTVRWPRPDLPSAGNEFRLALLEYEIYETDDLVSDYVYADRSAGERLVFADYFPL